MPPLPADTEEHRLEQKYLADHVLAASTHQWWPGRFMRKSARAPWSPDYYRPPACRPRKRHAGAFGQRFATQRPAGDHHTDTEIYIADTMGELGLFFRLSDIAFIGKSLVPLGGQNPLEALQLDCAVIHGPHMDNFQKITEEMAKTGSALTVKGEDALAVAVETLLKDDTQRQSLIENGREYMESHAKVAERVSHEILLVLKTDATGKNPRAAA